MCSWRLTSIGPHSEAIAVHPDAGFVHCGSLRTVQLHIYESMWHEADNVISQQELELHTMV